MHMSRSPTVHDICTKQSFVTALYEWSNNNPREKLNNTSLLMYSYATGDSQFSLDIDPQVTYIVITVPVLHYIAYMYCIFKTFSL